MCGGSYNSRSYDNDYGYARIVDVPAAVVTKPKRKSPQPMPTPNLKGLYAASAGFMALALAIESINTTNGRGDVSSVTVDFAGSDLTHGKINGTVNRTGFYDDNKPLKPVKFSLSSQRKSGIVKLRMLHQNRFLAIPEVSV